MTSSSDTSLVKDHDAHPKATAETFWSPIKRSINQLSWRALGTLGSIHATTCKTLVLIENREPLASSRHNSVVLDFNY